MNKKALIKFNEKKKYFIASKNKEIVVFFLILFIDCSYNFRAKIILN